MTALVTENMALLAAAPDGVSRVRNLILELAVQGRLYPRESDWRPIELRELVVTSGAGWSPSCEARPRSADEWGVLKVSAVSWGRFRPEENKALPAHLVPRPELEVQPGDFLVSRANTAELVARSVVVESTPPRLMLSDKIVRLKLAAACSPRFVQWANSAPASRGYYARVAGGTSSSMKNVSREQILSLPILLPPLAEQHRIVAKVDELMALCDRLEARQQDAEAAHAQLVQALLDSLTQARDADEFQAAWHRVAAEFHSLLTTDASLDAAKQAVLRLAFAGRLVAQNAGAALTQPDALPEGWREVQISEIALVGTGATPARTNPAYFSPPAFAWVTSGETSSELIEAAAQCVSALALAETNLTLYPPGTLVVAMYGQGKTRGQVSELAIEACTNQACAAIQLKDPSVAHRRYVKYFFEKSYDELREMAAGGAQPNLNLGKIKTTLIPLPPVEEQHRIVAKVTELLTLCDHLKACIAAARAQHVQLAEALVAQAVAA